MLGPSDRAQVTAELGHSGHPAGAVLSVLAVAKPYSEIIRAKEQLGDN
jgi:hypothetical protein